MTVDAVELKGRTQVDLLEERIALLEKRNPRALILSLHRTQLDSLRRQERQTAGLGEPALGSPSSPFDPRDLADTCVAPGLGWVGGWVGRGGSITTAPRAVSPGQNESR